MTIATKVHIDRNLVEIEVIGEVTDEEMFACQAALYEDEPVCLQLWDMTAADASRLTSPGLHRFVELAAQYGQARRGCRTALVVKTPLQYGLGRMSQLLGNVNYLPFSLRLFKERDEAFAWLESEQED